MKLPCACESGSFQGSPCLNCGKALKPEHYVLKESIRWAGVVIVVVLGAWAIVTFMPMLMAGFEP